jgi:hypothetical protein
MAVLVFPRPLTERQPHEQAAAAGVLAQLLAALVARAGQVAVARAALRVIWAPLAP